MFAKTVTTALASTALLVTVASAQTPSATGDRSDMPKAASGIATTSSFHGDWRASKMAGLRVYNDSNESLGTINDLLMDKSGSIKAAVLGVGGFLGMGEHLVAVPLDKIKFVSEPVPNTTASTGATGAGSSMSSRPATPPATTTGSAGSGTMNASKPNPWYPDHAVFNATKDELKAMPEFKYTTE